LKITQEDLDMCREYPNVNELDSICRWIRDLASIRRLGSRIEILQLRFNFAEEIEKEHARVKQVSDALISIQNSQRLTDVLKIILAFGNYLNGGTPKGGAHGFKLSALNTVRSSFRATYHTILYAAVIQFGDMCQIAAIV
jgi:diaphanous 1